MATAMFPYLRCIQRSVNGVLSYKANPLCSLRESLQSAVHFGQDKKPLSGTKTEHTAENCVVTQGDTDGEHLPQAHAQTKMPPVAESNVNNPTDVSNTVKQTTARGEKTNQCTPARSEKQTTKDTSTKTVASSKVAALRYVRLCSLNDPLDQIESDSSLTEAHDKYHTFIDGLSLRSLPSVTSIISKTMSDDSRYFLSRWQERMIKEMGEEGFKVHNHRTLELGSNLHTCIQEYLKGTSKDDLPLDKDNEGHWRSLARVFPDISDVKDIEVDVGHQTLYYQGKFDCVAKYRNMLCVIDWKTSKKPKPFLSNTYENPIQLAAYLGAINSNIEQEEDSKVRQCALVIAYPQGNRAHVHILDWDKIQTYWHAWLDRLERYWVIQSNATIK